MTDSTTENVRRFADPDRAYPHARTSQAVRGAGPLGLLDERDTLGDSAAPAGGLAISARDMAKWLTLQLAHGQLPGGGRLFSKAAHDEMWKPEILQPIDPLPDALAATQPMFNTYAFGWEVRDYHGAKIVWHEGAVLGFESVVVLLPEKNVGFAVEINSEDGEILFGLMYELLDHYLGLPANDWPAKFAAYKQGRLAVAGAALAAKAAAPAPVGPSLSLERYVGTYTDPWYGQIKVTKVATGLAVDFLSTPRMNGPLEHWQYDSFIARFTDKTIEPAYLTFALNADGHVTAITLKPVSPLADFSYDYQDLLFKPIGEN